MAALVLQSYRTHAVPPWIETCLASVRAWATAAGHDYEFVDDRLFDLLPPWFRERCGAQLLPQTDLARLLLLRARLAAGARRVIWLDADVLVCAPARLRFDRVDGFAFCAETWLERDPDGGIHVEHRVNNAAMVMDAGNPVLDFYIHACLATAAHQAPGTIAKLAFGPQLLMRLAQVAPMPVLGNVGMMSPVLGRELAVGGGPACAAYAAARGEALGAINLCASLVDTALGIDTAAVTAAIACLTATGGDVINQHVR